MEYINLIDQLDPLDKKRIINYINLYGISNEKFIGLDEWLQNWSHSNQKLYNLLGQTFIKKFDFEIEKNFDVFYKEIKEFLVDSSFIKKNYFDFCWKTLKKIPNLPKETFNGFCNIVEFYNFINDTIEIPIKYKRKDKRQTLQIQKGMKPIRAIQKIIDYFKDIYNFEGFEEFRIHHSMILNDKTIKGKLCISIHPFDFLTMSDNDSNWSSCMSWREEGCYHTGTIEMMNSNNVLCCYIENKNLFHFGQNIEYKKNPEYTWNNKRWRQLIYITKDILMSGKAYPYQNKDISLFLLDRIKELAEQNLNWKYKYGPELYYDMKHINGFYAMDNNKYWIKNKYTKKHNIIWDTKGMYNDMLNDNDTDYWCYRNKVKNNKIISVSGKAKCLCCNKDILNETGYDEYNERYENTGNVVCFDCLYKYFHCDICAESHSHNKHYWIKVNDEIICLCDKCYQEKIKICPDCGKAFYIPDIINIYGSMALEDFSGMGWYLMKKNKKEDIIKDICWFQDEFLNFTCNTLTPMYVCRNCHSKHNDEFETKEIQYGNNKNKHNILLIKEDIDKNKFNKYLYFNLKNEPYLEKENSKENPINFISSI